MRLETFLEKSEAALIAAIEIYNKPDFKYREETFALLALNAWELLLKAKIISDNGNKLRSIQVLEKRTLVSGALSKKEYVKKNRAGNAQTIGIPRAVKLLETNPASRLDAAVIANLDALTEIRDNAAHFVSASLQLTKQVLEIGTAAVKNYITLIKKWFGRDLSKFNLYLMPIGFLSTPSGTATGISLGLDEKRLVAFLTKMAQEGASAADPEFHVSLAVNLSFHRAKLDSAAAVYVTSDPSAPHVNVSEEDVRNTFKWDYGELTKRLISRYIDFKQNQKYHDVRKPLMSDKTFVNTRFLDPDNPRSARKDYYNPNVLQIFDQHYTKKS